MSDKTQHNWLLATRTVGGHAVRGLQRSLPSDGMIYGEVRLARDWTDIRWNHDGKCPGALQLALDPDSIPADPAPAVNAPTEAKPHAEFTRNGDRIVVEPWKVGDKVEWGIEAETQTGTIRAIEDGYAWVWISALNRWSVPLVDLRRPAPKTLEVVKQVWLCRDASGREFVYALPPGATDSRTIAGPVSITFTVAEET